MYSLDCVCGFQVQSLSTGMSGLGEETVSQSGGEDPNALVPPARWQEDKQFMLGVCGVVQNTGGIVCMVNVCDGGKRDVLTCLHYPL